MAGDPWDNYAKQEPASEGPWNDFAATPKPVEKPDDTGDFMRGFKKTLPELKQLAGGTLAAVGDVTGLDSVRDYGLDVFKRGQDATEGLSKPTDSASETFDRVKHGDLGAGVDFLQNAAGYVAGQGLETLAAAGAGALAGSELPGAGNVAGAVGGVVAKGAVKKFVRDKAAELVSEQIAKGVAKDVAEKAGVDYIASQAGKKAAEVIGEKTVQRIGGAALGAQAMNTGMELGSVYPDALLQAQEQGRELTGGEKFKAVGASLAAAGLESAADLFNLGALFRGVKNVAGEPVKAGIKQAVKDYAGRAAVAGGEGALREAGTEAAQTALERFGASKSLNDAEAWRDYIDSAAVGAVGGILFGGAAALNKQKDEATPGAKPTTETKPGPVIPLGKDPGDILRSNFLEAQAQGNAQVAEAAHAELMTYLQNAGRLLPAPDQALQVTPLGTVGTASQIDNSMLQAEQEDIASTQARENVGLTPDVNAARARHPAAASNLPDPNNGVLSRVVNMAANNGVLQAAEADKQQAVIQAAAEQQAKQPEAKKQETAAPVAEQTVTPNPEGAKAYIHDQLNRNPGRPLPAGLVGKGYGLSKDQVETLRKEVILERRAAITGQKVASSQNVSPQIDQAPAQAPELLSPTAVAQAPAELSRPQDTTTAGQSESSPATGQTELEFQGKTSSSTQDTPASDGQQFDNSHDILDDDITTQSGNAFSEIKAAEIMAKRTGAGAKVVPVDGGYVVRLPRTETQQNPTAVAPAADTSTTATVVQPTAAVATTEKANVQQTKPGKTESSGVGTRGRVRPAKAIPADVAGPVAKQPGNETSQVAQSYPEPDANGLVTTKDVYGDTVRVMKSDLDGTRRMLATYTKDGKKKETIDGVKMVHRENLDHDGSKKKAVDAELGVADYIGRRGAKSAREEGFLSAESARKAIVKAGYDPKDYDVKHFKEAGGFLAVRKKTNPAEQSAPTQENKNVQGNQAVHAGGEKTNETAVPKQATGKEDQQSRSVENADDTNKVLSEKADSIVLERKGRRLPWAEVHVAQDDNGKYKVAVGFNTDTSGMGRSFSLSEDHNTAEDAKRSGLLSILLKLPKSGMEPGEQERVEKIKKWVASNMPGPAPDEVDSKTTASDDFAKTAHELGNFESDPNFKFSGEKLSLKNGVSVSPDIEAKFLSALKTKSDFYSVDNMGGMYLVTLSTGGVLSYIPSASEKNITLVTVNGPSKRGANYTEADVLRTINDWLASVTPDDPIQAAAAETASSPENDRPEPTDAQKEAGNYKKGHVILNGMDISLETPAGASRKPEWPPLKNHYGYFKGTIGADKDHVDVFLSDDAGNAELPVFIIDQYKKDGSYDEAKVMLGWPTEAAAVKAYSSNYQKGWKVGPVTEMNLADFKAWVYDPAKTVKPAAQTDYSKRSVDWLRKNGGETITVSEAMRALVKKQTAITDDQDNWTPRDDKGHPVSGVDLYKPYAKKKLDDIGWAITNLLSHKKKHGDSALQTESAKEQEKATNDNKVPLSSVIASSNKKTEFTEADAVPTEKTALEFVKETIDALYDGEASLADYKAAFTVLTEKKADVLEQLGKQKKENLLDNFNSYYASRYKSEKKEKIVKEVYELLEHRFALGKEYGPNSYMMGGLAKYEAEKTAALKELVESQTEESLAEYQAERQAEAAARNAKNEERKAGISEPKTIQDFQNILRLKMADGMDLKAARLSLTPDQRAAFDALSAEQTRPERLANKLDAKTNVRIAGQLVAGDVVETKHTKHGHDLFVVQLAERVSREDYDTLNMGAKKLGGSYSSFRGRGAVPGFQFRTKESAEAFKKLAGGDNTEAADIVKTRRDAFDDDKTQSAVERLNEMADRLDDRASDVLSADRKTNTQRRAGQAARIEASANSDKALAKTMRNIANAIESDDAKYLDRVRQKVQVELLESMVKRGHDGYLRTLYPDYGKREQHLADPATIEAADYAEWPTYSAYRSDLAKLARQLMEVDGSKLLGKKLLKVADDVSKPYTDFAKKDLQLLNYYQTKNNAGEVRSAVFGTEDAAYESIARAGYKGLAIPMQVKRGQYRVIPSPQLAQEKGLWKGDNDTRISLTREFASELIEKASKANRRRFNNVSVPWQMESAHADRNALARMGIETPAEFRSALREFIGLRQVAAAEDKVKKLERAMIGRKNDGMDFFPTSREVVDEMISAAEIEPGMSVLEPSAGMGHIADALREAGTEPDIGELSGERRELLEAKGYNLVSSDFMEHGGNYDRILMNPPFSNRRDAEHVQHAFTLLNPNGRIVAIMGEGVFFGQDKKAQAFRDWLDSVGGTSEKLPEGSFMDPSLPVNTGVNARMVVIDKPAGVLNSLRDSNDKAKGQTVTKVEATIAPILGKWTNGPRVTVITTTPDNIDKTAEGWYDPETRRVYLVASNLRDSQRALEVLLHESIGHFGIEAISGPKEWAVISDIVSKMRDNPKHADLFNELARRGYKTTDADFVKEAVAVMSEKGVRNSIIDRVMVAIRRWLRSIGFNAPVNDSDLRQYIVQAARFVETGSVNGAQVGMRRGDIAQPSYSARPDTFFSALAESIQTAKGAPKKGNSVVWKQWLDGAQRRGEFKQEERDWLGVDAWLSDAGEVTREQLNDFVRANQVQVNDVLLDDDYKTGFSGENLPRGWRAVEDEPDLWVVLDEDGDQRSEGETREEAIQNAMDDDFVADNPDASGKTKFSKYQLPGGKNYRELLLTLPTGANGIDWWYENVHRPEAVAEMGGDESLIPETLVDYESDAKDALSDMYSRWAKNNGGKNAFLSHHFDQPNIVAHVRFNERTDADGKKVLFIEEIQSDWHQNGRKRGYASKKWVVKLGNEGQHGEVAGFDTKEQAETHLRNARLPGIIEFTNSESSVPDAPFKTSWPMLSMKRMIRYAADNGFDRIAWTTGEQQAERYDLSKKLQSVTWNEENSQLYAVDLDGKEVINKVGINEGQLEDYIGKDAAEKLLNAEVTPLGNRTIEGNGLKVGGEGMKGFYDKILPSEVNKFAKRFGGKVGTVMFRGDDLSSRFHGKEHPTHGLDITPEMKAAAQSGLPLFSKIAASVGGPLSKFFKALGKIDNAFQYKVSDKKTVEEVFADVAPDMKVKLKGEAHTSFTRSDDADAAALKYEITTGNGAPAYLYVEKGGYGRMYLDAASLNPGSSRGTALYMAIFNYAKNAGKEFIGDPNGLSDEALIRRTELMAAAAIKYGGTEFMRPHARQLDPGSSRFARLEWRDGRHEENLESLLETAYNNVLLYAPEITGYSYDFDAGQFRNATGQLITNDGLREIAGRARSAFAGRPVAPGAERTGEAAFGRTTIARAILAQSVIRRAGQEGAAVVDSVDRLKRSPAGVASAQGILYSKPSPAKSGVSISGDVNISNKAKESVKTVLDRVAGKITDLKPALLAAIPLNYLVDYAPKGMPAVKQFIDLRQQLEAFRNNKHQQFDAVAQDWLKYATVGGWKGLLGEQSDRGKELSDLMHDSTIAGVDPTLPASEYAKEPEKLAQHADLKRRYNAMPEDGQKLYSTVRKAYEQQTKDIEKALEDNLKKAADYRRDEAEIQFQAKLDEIKESGMSIEDKDQATAIAAKIYEKAVKAASSSATAKIIGLRQMFESMRVEQPYFPLKRFGKYFVSVRNKEGTSIAFSKFETYNEATAFASEQAAKGNSVTVGLDTDKDGFKAAVDPRFIADVDQILAGMLPEGPTAGERFADGEHISSDDAEHGDAMKDIRDAIYQRYLETLPDLSLRKSFIHRKKTPGYNPDALRSFASTMFHGSYQLARLKYGIDMQAAHMQAEEQAKRVSPVAGMALANEIGKRLQWVMNPQGGKAAQAITSAAFVWHLGANPAHLFLNATQTVMLGVPILGSKYGFGRTSSALTRATRDFAKGKGHIENADLTNDEKRAMKSFIDSGLIDKTQAHDLAGVGDTGAEYSALRARVMSKLGWFFHQSERFNREVTALAAYRLARETGKTHEAAMKSAADHTWSIHFDYSAANRARFMQGDLAKILTVFRNYNVNMLYRLFRDIHTSFKGETKEARVEAAKQLGAMLGMYGLMAGVTGVPFYGLVMMLAGLFDDDDEPFDAESRFKQGLVDFLGEDAAGVLLKGVPGSLAGVDLSERIGMPNLWFRSPDRELEGEDAYYYWMDQIAGAGFAIPKAMFSGLKMMHQGHIERGVETMLPNLAKSPVRAFRYAMQGKETNLNGDLLTDIGPGDTIARALGFTPLQLADQYDENGSLKSANAKVLKRRQQIINNYAFATEQRDREGMNDALESLRRFNAKNIAYKITGDSLKRSIKTRARNDQLNQGGIVMTKRLQALANQRDRNN